MNTKDQYVATVQKLLDHRQSEEVRDTIDCFSKEVEPEFVRDVLDTLKSYTYVHWLQDGYENKTAIVILLLHGEEYALCEIQLVLDSENWRILNIILRPLLEKEPVLFLGGMFVQASGESLIPFVEYDMTNG
jgi:hypothetical protein